MTTGRARRTEAAILAEVGAPLRLVELDLPPLAPGQVLVDLAYSGVCHSQLLEVRGARGVDRFLPHTLGHEGSGTVAEVGANVDKVRPGDTVVVSWIKGRGAEVPSTQYTTGEGTVNSGATSTFMRRAIVSENRVTPVPADLPLDVAALFGCAIPTGAGIVFNVARLQPGSSVAVFGVGGIGLSTVMAARAAGAAVIVAVDVAAHKLAQARAIGATHVVDARTDDPVSTVRALTAGRGVDCAVEAAGRCETMEAALAVTRDGGGLCVIAGNVAQGVRISIDPFDLVRGKRLIGTWGGDTEPDRDIPRYVDLYRRGELAVEQLVTHVYPLADVNRALDDLEAGRLGRALLDMSADARAGGS